MVLPSFVDHALKSEDLIVFDQGEQTRCFCDIRDALEMIHILSHSPEYIGETFNIGNSSNDVSIQGLAELIVELTKTSSKIVHKNFDKVYSQNTGEIYKRKLDSSKIQSVYQCRYNMNDIITSYIEGKINR
jgi:UDP-glucose 4-epimerase